MTDYNQAVTCPICGTTTPISDTSKWNAELKQGVIVKILCPNCQTTEQDLEAQINEATLDYTRDTFGRLRGTIKGLDK